MAGVSTPGDAITTDDGEQPGIRVLVGSPAAGLITEPAPAGTILLDLGDDHPSRAGLLELRIWTEHGDLADDARIARAEVIVGAMHRGAEKLYEVRDYRQILMLADRHDWQAPAASELAIACACERLLGLEVPERAQWLRTLLAEHTRILSHLGFLGYLWTRAAADSPTVLLRERLRRQLQSLTGNRVHPMINRLGGLAADADADWLEGEVEVCEAADRVAAEASELLRDDRLWSAPADLPLLTPAMVKAYGVTGPAARSAGVRLDLRRQRPYLAYGSLTGQLTGQPATGSSGGRPDGSAAARFAALAGEVVQSGHLIRACVERLHQLPGPVAVRLGKIVKLPEGEIYLATEAPLGQAGCYLTSRGEKTPWRLKLRTPSFNNVSALQALLVGVRLADLELMLASTGYVVGDIDK